MRIPHDPYIRVAFPNGMTFAVRQEQSGIVLSNAKPIDDELAADMLIIKAWKLSVARPVGCA